VAETYLQQGIAKRPTSNKHNPRYIAYSMNTLHLIYRYNIIATCFLLVWNWRFLL